MLRFLLITMGLLLLVTPVHADETQDAADALVAAADAEAQDNQPKQMSGMSILGNEEAPKALVIIPWKSSELGDEVSLSDTLEERARPVDKEVFLRELAYHEIRSGHGP